MRLGRRVQLLFGALFALLLVGVLLDVYVESVRDDVASNVRERLQPARDELAELLTALVDQETGQRGFLLTGDDEFLTPYVAGREEAAESIRALRLVLLEESEALAGVERVRSRVDAWQQLGADFEIRAKEEHRDEIVAALVASGTGRRLFDQARVEIADVSELLEDRLDAEQDRLDGLQRTLAIVRATSVLAAVLLLGMAGRLLSRWVTTPLTDLGAAVRRAASGALREPIPAEGPPDLAELAADVDAMRRRLLAEVDDAARARAALADRGMIVVTLREDLAPADVTLPDGLDVAGRFLPAKGLVAGDWYDIVRLDDDRIVLALVDVSGHGAEVATFALRTKTLVMAAIGSYEPGAIFEWLDSHLGETGELFLTGVIAEVSASTGRIRYASAGHPSLLLGGLTGVEQLGPTGPLLGPLPGRWTTAEAELQRGGVLVAYSDGLLDARDAAGNVFGAHRLAEKVVDTQLSGPHIVADAVLEAVERFAVSDGNDDITLCVIGR